MWFGRDMYGISILVMLNESLLSDNLLNYAIIFIHTEKF